jgi:hypothetical protein
MPVWHQRTVVSTADRCVLVTQAPFHGRLINECCVSIVLLLSTCNAEHGLPQKVPKAQDVRIVLRMQGLTLAEGNGVTAKRWYKVVSAISFRISGKRWPVPQRRDSWKEWLLGEAAGSFVNVRFRN